MKTWDEFYPFILVEVMECPNPVVDFALVQAAREFCRRTSVWVEWMEFVADGTTQRFDFDLPSKTELVAARRATVDGVDVPVLGNRSLPADWTQADTTSDVDALIHISLTEFMLYPLPAADAQVMVQLALQPTLAGTGVSDDVFSRYAEAISKGALYRLMSSSNKPYTNLAAASQAFTDFERLTHSAANEAWRQAAPADRRVKKQD